MRMSSWSPQVIRFMEDASAFTTYFKELARVIRANPRSDGYVCDAGCGMGQLSFELAHRAQRIDAIDRSVQAIAHLNRRLDTSEHANIFPALGDIARNQPATPYDLMVFCLSASPEAALEIAQTQCSGDLIVINKIHSKMEADRSQHGKARTDPGKRPLVYDFEQSVAGMRARGMECNASELTLDFGQPFRTLDDAALYFRLFRTRNYPAGISSNQLMELLTETDDETFPYYLPVLRHLAVFSIDVTASRSAGVPKACVLSA